MVESNNDEERLSRIERMLEQLQREAAAFKSLAAKAKVIMEATPTLKPPTEQPASRQR